jgi:hypothetical protein
MVSKKQELSVEAYAMLTVFFFVGLAFPLALWTERNLEFWLGWLRGQPVDVNWWWCLLLTVLGPVGLCANVVAEIVRAFAVA